MDDKKEELREVKERLVKKEKELRKLEAKKNKLESKLSKETNKVKDQINYLKNYLSINIEKISSKKTLLIEEGGNPDFFFLDIYLVEDTSPMFLGRWPCDADGYDNNSFRIMTSHWDDPDLAPFKFLEEELEPNSEHEHDGSELTHRTWKIDKGEKLIAFENLICNSHFSEIYSKKGFNGLRNLREDLKKRLDDVFPDISDLLREDNFRKAFITRKEFKKPTDMILNYALDNKDLTISEVLVALKLEDEEFAKKLEKRKNLIRNRLTDLENAFGHYLNEKEVGSG